MDPMSCSPYDRPVPRYTSYPTAAQFDATVGPAEHAEWLSGLQESAATLYLHVPFCQQLCWYCACHTMAMRRAGTLDAYAEALRRELAFLAERAPDFVVDAIQWGGGTPAQLGAGRLASVGRQIAGLFERMPQAEVSMEVDPRHCSDEIADVMAELGVTRVSLGVQDFDVAVQRAINRLQSFEETAASLQRLRMVGIARFNIDLVYGLPGQSLETLSRTLEKALTLEPDRFAVFGYAHVPWMKSHQKLIDAASLPASTTRAAMASLVAERLVGAGYVRIGLDHYAKADDSLVRAVATGTLRRNFQGYVADESPWVVGVGASAISYLPAGYAQNDADVTRYMRSLTEGRLATARGVAVSADDRLRAEIIGQLMCVHTADVGDACHSHGVDPIAFLDSVGGLAQLVRDGMISMGGGRLVVTDRGRPLVRYVCAAFDRYYTGAAGKHAPGI